LGVVMKAEDAAELVDQEKAQDDFKKRAAIVIGILAMLLAITGLGGNNATKEAINENIQASNAFGFFQAKNIRQTSLVLAANEVELAWVNEQGLPESAKAVLRDKLADYRKTIARYESEPETGEGKKELMVKAREHEQKRDRALKQDPYFDYAEALLQIAIVLISVSIVADQRWLLLAGGGLGAIGGLLMINGFLLLVEIPGLG
jgi:ParB-like chromosome segregation protein Spo0J